MPFFRTFLCALCVTAAGAQTTTLDLAATPTDKGVLQRILGASGMGQFGVPLGGGDDVSGDGLEDYVVGFMTAAPLGRSFAGEVDLVFGDGTLGGQIDTAINQARLLRIYGAQNYEMTGTNAWMADVTGDGIGDLLICHQNHSPYGTRTGAGALTILVGGSALVTYAETLQPVDLAAPPMSLTLSRFYGASAGDRLCLWTRTGDVTGDGISDIVVGADQQSSGTDNHRGAAYLIRGGAYLAAGGIFDLATPAAPALSGRVAHVVPPSGSSNEYHFGATVQIGDLDGNGKGEVIAAATINRYGAQVPPVGGSAHASAGAPNGRVYILWDDNLSTPWSGVLELSLAAPPGSLTTISGGSFNQNFGEELLAGLDYDGDGHADLFVGDLTADASGQGRTYSGAGYVLYHASTIKGLSFSMETPPMGLATTTILGPSAYAIGADTAAHGDYNADGLGDLAFCSPQAAPQGRTDAGTVHVLVGRHGGWPAVVDTAAPPPAAQLRMVEIQGAHGTNGGDAGDVLCYSAASGDVDANGRSDLLINEMKGNGSSAIDVGNLLLIEGGAFLPIFDDGFETGDAASWDSQVP